MKIGFFKFLLLVGILVNLKATAQECVDNWLSTEGNKIVDVNGQEVYLRGVNWFGFENDSFVIDGIWARDTESVLQQIKDLGFNCIRIPWANVNLFRDIKITFGSYGTDPYTGVSPMNPTFEQNSTTPLDVLDVIVQWCQDNDMRIILDNHSRSNESSAHAKEPLWYRDGVTSHEEWIANWVSLAERYKDFTAVVGMDLNNEPHGNPTDPFYKGIYATWGSGNKENDWKMAAEECGNAILKVNPNVLIIVEGIQEFIRQNGETTNYWWGGNLQGVREYPITLETPNKLVYSPHEYGPFLYNNYDLVDNVSQPWFQDENFEEDLPEVWEENFGFINTGNTAPLLIGEFGIKNQFEKSDKWMNALIKYIDEQDLHFTYWCMNPNSADTGGIFSSGLPAYYNIVQWRFDYLEPILSDPIPNCVAKTLSNERFEAEVIDFKVYPNPTTDVITFSTTSNNLKKVALFNLAGSRVHAQSSISSTSAFEFDTANLAAGVYLAKVTSKKGVTVTIKVVKR